MKGPIEREACRVRTEWRGGHNEGGSNWIHGTATCKVGRIKTDQMARGRGASVLATVQTKWRNTSGKVASAATRRNTAPAFGLPPGRGKSETKTWVAVELHLCNPRTFPTQVGEHAKSDHGANRPHRLAGAKTLKICSRDVYQSC